MAIACHAADSTQVKNLYSLYGDKAPVERELEYLSGYRGSRPVRIGNAARDQLQLDVYGEVVDAAAQFAFHGGHLDREMPKALIGFGDYVVKNWDQPMKASGSRGVDVKIIRIPAFYVGRPWIDWCALLNAVCCSERPSRSIRKSAMRSGIRSSNVHGTSKCKAM
jgi:hypothetical protein